MHITCGTPCLCTLSASAFIAIESALHVHQLDLLSERDYVYHCGCDCSLSIPTVDDTPYSIDDVIHDAAPRLSQIQAP